MAEEPFPPVRVVQPLVGDARPRVWLMISGYGSQGSSSDRVAFGDDAAVAGGLVAWDGPAPCFCGDAVADPLAGLAGAASVLAALESGGAWIIEASMAQAEGGSVSDYPKIARVIINRLAINMPLQFDSVLLYGLNKYAINVTDAQIATPGPYNDFEHAGLIPYLDKLGFGLVGFGCTKLVIQVGDGD